MVTLVTGAAQGVGAAVAERLARLGARTVILVDRDGAGLAAVAARLGPLGAHPVVIAADLTGIEAAQALIAEQAGRLGRLDLLVNAAGLTDRGGIEDTSVSTFDRLFAVNTRTPFFVLQACLPFLRVRGGVAVNVCSMLAYGGPPFLLGYSASKAALVALTKGSANALKRDAIRVFGINLGWTVTPNEHRMQTGLHGLPEDWATAVGSKQSFGRLLVPGDVADLVGFLASPGARMMTGAVIDLDQFVAGTVDNNPGAPA